MVYHDQPEPAAFERIIALRADYVNLDDPDLFLETQRRLPDYAANAQDWVPPVTAPP